jgi:uncharacterized protein YkwD
VIAKAGLTAALCACSIANANAAPSDGGIEDGVLDQINYARAHPQEYAEQLRAYLGWFDGHIVFEPGDANGTITREGPSAVDEAIAFLEQQAPLPPLSPGEVLALAARDHADAQGPSGATGHVSFDGAGPGQRVKRHGGDIYVGETITYGPGDPQAVVRSLIIDDGVPGRGHRAAVFSNAYRFAGVGCRTHARYRVVCVVDYAETPDGNPMQPGGVAAR